MRAFSAVAMAGLLTISAGATAQQAGTPVSPATSGTAAIAGDPLPRAKPEEVGLSSEKLAVLRRTLEAEVASGQMPGAVVAIARRGKLVYLEGIGYRDKAAGTPMTTDTIFNIASMTKPMTAVGGLMLIEEGRLAINDPLSKYFPAFAQAKVAKLDPTGTSIIETVPAARQITLQDLMRHTSGVIYGGRGTTAVHKLYPSGSAAIAGMTGAEVVDKLGGLPLLHQPGAVWDYGFGLDLLGLVIEKVSGQSLGAYLQTRLFDPLGMTDTGFAIPSEKAGRYARALPNDPASGQPQEIQPVLTTGSRFECGGGCAGATATDYMRFALMLMKGGSYGGHRILSRKTVEYMLANQLGPEVRNLIANADPTRADYGFGLGLAVRQTAGVARLLGSVGDFSWPGASGTNWWADPKEDLVVVFMAHTPGPLRWRYREAINALVYAAIMD